MPSLTGLSAAMENTVPALVNTKPREPVRIFSVIVAARKPGKPEEI